MAEGKEMPAEGLQEVLSVELGKLREEAGELMRKLEDAAATARGPVLDSISCLGNACAIYLILYAAVTFFFPGGSDGALGRLVMGLAGMELAWYTFLVVCACRSNQLLFLERRSELAGKVHDLKSRVAALGTGLAAAADPSLLSRSEELRAYINGFPDTDGPCSQFFYNAMQVCLMVVAGLQFLFGLQQIYSAML